MIFSVPLNGLQEPLQVSSHILLTCPHHSLNTSILTQNEVSGSSYISPAPVLELANSPRSPGAFSWRRVFQRPKSGRQVRSLPLSLSLLPGPLRRQAQTDRCRRTTRVYFCTHQKPLSHNTFNLTSKQRIHSGLSLENWLSLFTTYLFNQY